MFNYEFIKWNFRINKRALSILFTLIYLGSIIPLIVLGFYDWPSADDFSMALQARQYFVQNGNILGTVLASLQKSYYVYSHYEGYFFSIILTCICPSVFGEAFYIITPFLILSMLTIGVSFFFNSLFVKVWNLDKDLTNIMCMLTLIMMVQFILGDNVRAEAFFWYSGAINYSFTFGLAFIWIGLLLRFLSEENVRRRRIIITFGGILGFLMGGANYLTALELAIISVLIIFIIIMVKLGHFTLDEAMTNSRNYVLLLFPTIMNLIGFACSCFSPGNSHRATETQHYGAVKSILLSLYSTFDMIINDMMRWETIVCLLILIPISWNLAKKLDHRLKHPIIFSLFAYLLVSSNMTPPFFASANFDAGRLKALAWMEFVFMASLTIFYITAWARQTLYNSNDTRSSQSSDRISKNSSMIIAALAALLVMGSALCIVPDPHYYTSTSAMYDIFTNTASTYRKENLERLTLLTDENLEDVELMEHSVKPVMLFYQDVTPYPDEWINYATATYYNKKSVVLIPNN